MKKSLFICVLIVLATLSCCEREFNNPVDPDLIDDNLLPPDSLQIKVVDEDILELSWVDICKIEDSFQIFRKTGTGNYAHIKTLPANSSIWQDEDVSLGRVYTYQIYAVNDNYKSPKSTESSFNYSLYPPTSLSIEALAENKIKLSWEVTNHFAEGYKIDTKLKSGEWQENFASVESDLRIWEYEPVDADSLITAWRVKAYYKSLSGINSDEVSLNVAEPIFSKEAGTYYDSFELTISCATPGAQIRYTTDGSIPTSSSTLYGKAIPVNVNSTIKARAFKNGWQESEIAIANYDLMVSTPTFSIDSGTYTSSQYVSITCVTSGAAIRYTTDGSTPNSSSPLYSAAIQISENTTLKDKAFKSGWTDSETAKSNYVINLPTVATPTFKPDGGNYSTPQKLIISCATEGAQIRYTTDGSTPTNSSTLYTKAISLDGSIMIKAKAFKYDWLDSSTASANYIFTVFTPTFNPAGGTYASEQSVVISCASSGAQIRYTTDGSTPTVSSTLYSGAIQVSENTSIKAKAFKSGWTESETANSVYVLKVATPTFNPDGGIYDSPQSVTISCATTGADIRYTTDGSMPSSFSTLYCAAILVSENTSIKAKAFKNGWSDSEVANSSYVFNMAFVQGGTFNNGTSYVTLSSFYITKYETTQAEYLALMGTNPSYYTGNLERPVEGVNWLNAIEYCNRRSMQEGLTPCYSYSTYGTNPDAWPSGWNGNSNNHTNVSCNWTANGYRLPTEMEWMYAAKGGNQSQGYTYSGSNDINAVAWYAGNNSPNGTKPVGTKLPNELGIYDMSGNVWEWNWDIYGSYPSGAQTNPHGPASGSNRVLRGGCWNIHATYCTVSVRSDSAATYSYSNVGFRVCRVSP
ncbi:MAG: chitobiase/beta-hexosaminidase C-terminal domain-containing protein [Candidatus Cloacimonetes bacterium]|nr:chitobiase/beta-hexosaminidase C-terminal domain-containing protein [Candidatus Cloacimonadota bacterium]